MSQEIFDLINQMDLNELETQVALQCSPLITGIKISNLLIVSQVNRENIIKMFKESSISYYILYKSEEKIIFLLYIESELQDYMMSKSVNNVMRFRGYRNQDIKYILKEFSERYSNYMKYKDSFPHEMGLLLGYPVDDVLGFIENEGKNFLYAGYWKVYGDVQKAVTLFEKYNRAKELVIQMVAQGLSIPFILKCNSNKETINR